MLQYPWLPHLGSGVDDISVVQLTDEGKDTIAEVEALVPSYCAYLLDAQFRHQVNDIMQLSIRNSLPNTTNANTLGLVRARFPANLDYDASLRFLTALTYEVALGYPALEDEVKSLIVFNMQKQKYTLEGSAPIYYFARDAQKIATKIVEIMKWLENNAMSQLAGHDYVDFVRDSALVELEQKIGIKIQTTTTGVRLNVHNSAGTPAYYEMPANSTIYVERLNGLSNVTTTDTTSRGATLTGVNGASLIHTRTFTPTSNGYTITDNPDHLLNEDATYQMTIPIQIWGVRSSPIQAPTIVNRLPDISIATGVTESVNIANLFGGTRITVTAESSDTTKATVQMNESKTSIGVVARSAGKSTITITGSNESGEVMVTFVVTVT